MKKLAILSNEERNSIVFGEPKTIEEISKQKTFFHGFQNIDELIDAASTNNHCLTKKQLAKKARKTNLLIVAGYSDLDFDGKVWILFEKKGVLYEVHAMHDSIAPFLWEPEEVSIKELINRVSNGTFKNEIQFEIKEFLLKKI